MRCVGWQIERIQEFSRQMNHINKNMTTPRTGEPLTFDRADKLIKLALTEIQNSCNIIEDML